MTVGSGEGLGLLGLNPVLMQTGSEALDWETSVDENIPCQQINLARTSSKDRKMRMLHLEAADTWIYEFKGQPSDSG